MYHIASFSRSQTFGPITMNFVENDMVFKFEAEMLHDVLGFILLHYTVNHHFYSEKFTF